MVHRPGENAYMLGSDARFFWILAVLSAIVLLALSMFWLAKVRPAGERLATGAGTGVLTPLPEPLEPPPQPKHASERLRPRHNQILLDTITTSAKGFIGLIRVIRNQKSSGILQQPGHLCR